MPRLPAGSSCPSFSRTPSSLVSGALVLGLLLTSGAARSDEAVLIGGGYELQASQGQIELNVNWIAELLDREGIPRTTFFTDGDTVGPDVQFTRPADEPAGALEPLARVFGELAVERRRYREHAVSEVAGGTRRDRLEPALATLLERTAGDPLLLVYNGHGSQSPLAPAGVTLNLWDNTTLSARELHALVDTHRGASEKPFRYVFTQCYSGGFHRLAYADADDGLALADTPRCGFTAESAYRLAEGCSAGIDIGDYRDYTTFFFAALGGRARDGRALDGDPDSDRDGEVTLREAHLHTLEKAWSTDLSRSSSEDWLESWQPWYLRWLPPPADTPDNEYTDLFDRLATRAEIPPASRSGRPLRARLAEHQDGLEQLYRERGELRLAIRKLQGTLQARAGARWPALLGPYTTSYRALAADGELDAVVDWLEGEPDYATLLERQARDAELESTLLDAERDATQALKLLRLRHLATLKGQLATYGSDDQRASYGSLLACEETPLDIEPAARAATAVTPAD